MDSPRSPQSSRLESWKEIARHLNRTVRTVQRWEREQGLPVHRLQHNKLASVFAYIEELDAWWEQRRVSLEATSEEEPGGVPPAASRRSRLILTVAAALLATTVGGVWLVSAGRGPNIAESDRLYAVGRQRWNQRTPAAFREALIIFDQAIEANPKNARAYSGRADTYSLLEAFGVLPRSEALPLARAAAVEAVQLGDALAEPHASLSFVYWTEGDRAAAFREIDRALALDPDYATALHWYALYLQDSGRFVEAIEAGRRARASDPHSAIIASDLAIMLRNGGRKSESLTLLEEVVSSHPTFADANIQLAEAYRLEGRYQMAAEQLTRAVQNGDSRASTQARQAWVHAQLGDLRYGVGAVTRLRAMQDLGEHVPPQAMLEALVAAGDLDAAFALVEEGLAGNAIWATLALRGDTFEKLRADPRWHHVEPRVVQLLSSVAREGLERRSIQP